MESEPCDVDFFEPFEWGEFDDTVCFPEWFYGMEEEEEEDEETHKADKLIKPPKELIAPPKTLKDALHVTEHSFNIAANTSLHRTDLYACTQKSDDDKKKKKEKLVVRRGGDFTLTLKFSRAFNTEADDIKLQFKTGGVRAKQSSFTNGQFRVIETGERERNANTWSGKLVKTEGNVATIDVHIAANCAIGNWQFTVTTFLNKDGRKRQAIYDPGEKFVVLFNPWCKDDTTFMPDLFTEKSHFDDYVLGDHGVVYRGNKWSISSCIWEFGQFEQGVLEAAIYLLNCLEDKVAKRSSPVDVARKMTRMVNEQDDDGVLAGNWSGDYNDGKSPSSWDSTVDILKQYMTTKQPVKYGQCWVFSAVLTTLCRALGLPARSVTNFASAHDTDANCTVDKYLEKGKITSKGDSIWNFHVWNEVWFQRPEIPIPRNHNEGCFDGWQVIDATPQEESGGIMTCGPSPLYAIKRGMVTIPYDTGFVFAEVSGDLVYWAEKRNGDYAVMNIKRNAVGHNISTKLPEDPKKETTGDHKDIPRLDLTKNYKFPYGSMEDQEAKANAAYGSEKFMKDYMTFIHKQSENVKIKMTHAAECYYGEDLVVCLNASYRDKSRKNNLALTGVVFRFLTKDYTDKFTDSSPISVVPQPDKILKKDEECCFEVTLKFEEYKNKLNDDLCMSIQAKGSVMEGSKKVQYIIKRHDFTWLIPGLKVKLPESVNEGEEFVAEVTFKNSQPEKLTNCMLCFSANSYIVGNEARIVLDGIPENGEFNVKFPLRARKAKKKVNAKFSLMTTQLTGDKVPKGKSTMKIKKLE